MELVKSRNNDTLALKVINPTDLLPTMYEKVQYNFDQILKFGGGIEGKQGREGKQGEIGATGIGKKGDKGDRGSKIFFYGSGISDGDIVTNTNHLIGDVVIDNNGVYFEVVDVNGTLKYQQQLNIVSIISAQYWLNQYQYQNQSTNNIVKWLLADPGISNVENNLVLATRTIGISNDISKFYRVLLGMDAYPGLINSTLLLANILVDDLEDATNLNTTKQLGIKFRANSTSTVSANSFWLSYIEQPSRYVGILENMATKMYLINDTLSDDHQCHILSKSFYFHNYGSNIDSPTDFVKLTVESDTEIDFSGNAVVKSGSNNSTLTSNFGNNIFSEFVTINGEYRTVTQLPIAGNAPILNITIKSSIIELTGNSSSVNVISKITSGFDDGHKITIMFKTPVTLSYVDIFTSGFRLRNSEKYGMFDADDSITFRKRSGFYEEVERHENKNAKLFLRSQLPVADYNQLIPSNGFNGLYQQLDIVSGTLLNTAPFSNLTISGVTVIITEVGSINPSFLFNYGFGVCYQKQYLINGTSELEVFYRKRYYVSGPLNNSSSYQWTSWTKIVHESTINNFTSINNFGAATNFAGLMSVNGGLKLGVRTLTVIGNTQLIVHLQPTDQYIKINDNTTGNYGARIYLPVNNNDGRILMLDLGFNTSGNSYGFYRIYNTDNSFNILSTVYNADFNGGGASIQLSNDPSRPDRLLIMLMCTGTSWVVIWSSAYDSNSGSRYKGNSNNW